MAAYVVVRAVWLPHTEAADPDEVADAVNWPRWVAFGAVAFVLILVGAHFVNGPETMKSANTRWPLWSWNQGPFPGR
jgi:hypothetical protein